MGEGNAASSSGFSDIKNAILYGAGSGEWYPHEFVHLYANPKFKNADPMLLEGLAIFFGGTRGHSANWLMKHADSLLSANHAIDIDSVISDPWSGNLDYITTVDGLFGCLLCKMAYEKGGIDLLLTIMEYGPLPDAGRFKILKHVFGIKREDGANVLRKKIAEYAMKVPKNTQ